MISDGVESQRSNVFLGYCHNMLTGKPGKVKEFEYWPKNQGKVRKFNKTDWIRGNACITLQFAEIRVSFIWLSEDFSIIKISICEIPQNFVLPIPNFRTFLFNGHFK